MRCRKSASESRSGSSIVKNLRLALSRQTLTVECIGVKGFLLTHAHKGNRVWDVGFKGLGRTLAR